MSFSIARHYPGVMALSIPQGNLPCGNPVGRFGMTAQNQEHRRARLKQLLTYCGGKQSTLASLMDKQPNYISRLLSEPGATGHKNIGEEVIAAASKAFGLPLGWFDMSLDVPPPSPQSGQKFSSGSSSTELPRGDHIDMPETFDYSGAGRQATGVPVTKTIRVRDGGLFEETTHAAPQGLVAAYGVDVTAYAVKVRGDGMAPAIKDGSFLIVEPDGKCVAGEEVMVYLKDGSAMCRTLQFERSDTVSVTSVTTNEPLTLERTEIIQMLPIVAVYAASKWRSA